MEIWRLIETWRAESGFQMALDEALLLHGGERPVLRLYTFEPAALSLGYFQRFAEVPAAGRAAAVVRRMTGGGAIHHQNELTFSIAAPAEHPLYRGPLAASYERIHAAVAETLSSYGLDAAARGADELLSDRAETGMCFHHSTPLDLAWGGRKGVGSAQRRSRGRVLHHGSIKLGPSPLEGEVATVGGRSNPISPETFGARLIDTLSRRFGIRFRPDEPTEQEREHALGRASHFRSDAFVRRR